MGRQRSHLEAPSDPLQVCFPAETSSAWLWSCLPTPPQAVLRGAGFIGPLSRYCHPGSGVGLTPSHHAAPVPGGGQAFSGCISADVPLSHRKLRAGHKAGSPGPSPDPHIPVWDFACKPWRGHRNQLSCQPSAAVPAQDSFLPAAHGVHVSAEAGPSTGSGPLGGACLGPLGGDARARGGSEDLQAPASEGRWSPHHLSIAGRTLAGINPVRSPSRWKVKSQHFGTD